jgi:hypothetical protein
MRDRAVAKVHKKSARLSQGRQVCGFRKASAICRREEEMQNDISRRPRQNLTC